MARDRRDPDGTFSLSQIITIEGVVIAFLIGVIGYFANYTLSNINDNIHQMGQHFEQMETNVSSIQTNVAILNANFSNIVDRVDRVEKEDQFIADNHKPTTKQ